MHLIVGLGNPGEKYKNNRHNIGFLVVDALNQQYGKDFFKSKFHGEYSQGEVGNKKILLLKPSTYMNRSGISVLECSQFFKVAKANIIVIHDEIDLETGRLKVKIGGSNAGHNGLKSIDAIVGSDYVRVRFGVSHPGDRDRVADYVLSDFNKLDVATINVAIQAIVENMDKLIAGDLSGFMNNCSIAIKLEG